MSTAEKNPPLVSVVAVSYNHERFVTATLESVRRQTLADWELIYADDASQDASAKVACDWLDRESVPAKRILHAENQGLCRTLNEALRLCRGKYVQLIACDDILRPEKFEKQIGALESARSDVAIACSNYSEIDESGRTLRSSFYPTGYALPDDMFIGTLETTMVLSAPTVLLRRSIYSTIGEYDESYAAEGFQTWLKVFEKHSAIYLPDVLVDYRILPSSFSRDRAWHIKFAEQRLRAAESFECEGARHRAVERRRMRELLTLAELHLDEQRFQESRDFIERYLKILPADKKSNCRKLLSMVFSHNPHYARSLMDAHNVSSGSALRDFCYRSGFTFGDRILSLLSAVRHKLRRMA